MIVQLDGDEMGISLFSDKTPKLKAMKKRIKFLEQSYGGSIDSQISNGGSVSPVSFSKVNSVENDEAEGLRSKLFKSEQVNMIN